MMYRRVFLVASMLGLLSTIVPAASADTYKLIKFTGSVRLSGCAGFGYPGPTTIPPVPKPGPKPGTVVFNIPPQGNHCNFRIGSTACIKTSVGKKVSEDICTVLALGTIWGYCGYATGLGTASITTPTKGTINTSFKFTDSGGGWTVTGGGFSTNVAGEFGSAPTTGSCATKTATGFTIVGELFYKDCTGGVVVAICDVP